MDKPNGKEDAVQVWLPARTVERIRELADDRELHTTAVPIHVELFCELNPEPIKRGDWVIHQDRYRRGLVVEVGDVYVTVLGTAVSGEMLLQVAPIEEWYHCAPPLVYAVRDRLLRAAGLEEATA
jgi:hypothetical protein